MTIAQLQCRACETVTNLDEAQIPEHGQAGLWEFVFAWLKGEACRCAKPTEPKPAPTLRLVS